MARFRLVRSDEMRATHVPLTMIAYDCFFQISENDDLPTNVCRKCMDNVNNWHIFKSVCERTQNKLESLIKDGNQLEQVGLFF